MNERIKRYAQDCQSTSLGNYSFDVERFAKWIIDDFINICETQSNGEDIVKDIVYETKQYFGVK
jgi:hypothetical protein